LFWFAPFPDDDSFLANSSLVGYITNQQSSTTRMIATKQYDYLNRLLTVSSAPSASGQIPVAFNYAYNMANQRTRAGLNDSSGWTYEYDYLGQVTSGKRAWSDGTMVPGEQFQYTFDNIGNRIATLAGGDQNGGSLRSATYTANNLNEYSSRTVPGASDIIGAADVNGAVTVNGQSTYRHGQYYQTALTLTNGSGAIWQSVTNAVVDGTTNSVTGNIFLPPSAENFTYDLDGNLKSDGRWTNTWDAENRLVTIQGLSGLPTGANKQLQFVYDWQGRRIQKIVSNWNGSSYVTQYTNRFLYDGWNLIAELNGANNALIRSYIWGMDLSRSFQGAGGAGGLLTVKTVNANPLFVAYDGNGNVSSLVDGTTGTNAAQFVYGPFGELLQISPPTTTNSCPIRFSSKYYDDETDLAYYGYRYFNPNEGRWLNFDPVGERGGYNPFVFVNNKSTDAVDILGWWGAEDHYDMISSWLRIKHLKNNNYWEYNWHCILLNVYDLLKAGNDDVDGTGPFDIVAFCDAQSTQNAYQHSMRAPNQTVAAAQAMYDMFIQAHVVTALQKSDYARMAIKQNNTLLAKGYMDDAIRILGQAQHPVADSTSPAHAGFQVWFGPEYLLGGGDDIAWYVSYVLKHHNRETHTIYIDQKVDAVRKLMFFFQSDLDYILSP
jgi:RHS repeat-associated protein